jgi:dihydropyrimidinase
VTASDDYTADILVEGERIRAIGLDLPVSGEAEVHDAVGLLVLPGGVDPHMHLDWDFGVARTADTFGSGTIGHWSPDARLVADRMKVYR